MVWQTTQSVKDGIPSQSVGTSQVISGLFLSGNPRLAIGNAESEGASVIEQTLVQIRERSPVDLLDLALVVVRRKPGTLALASLVGIAPFAAFNAWLFQAILEMPPIVPLTFWMLEAPFATAPLTVVLGGLMFGQRPTATKVLTSLFRGAFAMIVLHGILRFLTAFWLTSRLMFANEVILLERGKWWKILGRGRDLASGRSGELFLLGLFQLVLTYLFAMLFYIGVSAIGKLMIAEDVTWDVPDTDRYGVWLFQVPIWIATAFFTVVRFLTYIDQRIRLEGWEVELRLRAIGESMREARRW